LLALHYLLPGKRERRRPRLAGREFYDDAMTLCEIVADAEAADPSIAGREIAPADGETADAADAAELDAEAPELESSDDARRGRRRRRGRGPRGPREESGD